MSEKMLKMSVPQNCVRFKTSYSFAKKDPNPKAFKHLKPHLRVFSIKRMLDEPIEKIKLC